MGSYKLVASIVLRVDYYEENEGSMVFMRAQWSSVWRVSRGVSNVRPHIMLGVWKSQCNQTKDSNYWSLALLSLAQRLYFHSTVYINVMSLLTYRQYWGNSGGLLLDVAPSVGYFISAICACKTLLATPTTCCIKSDILSIRF